MSGSTTEQSSAVTSRVREDTFCSYLHTSSIYYKRFLSSYSDGTPEGFSISFNHFYKAWDSLFQSNLLFAGWQIRYDKKGYALGETKGMTEILFKDVSTAVENGNPVPLALQENAEKWKITKFSETLVHPRSNKLYNTLDLLRELRNADAHDFLVNHRFSYSANVYRTNNFVIPLMEEYLASYAQMEAGIKQDCLEAHKNSVFCAFKSLEESRALRDITTYPSPLETVGLPNNSFSKMLKARIKFYPKAKRPILASTPSSGRQIKKIVRDQYPYHSIKELCIATGLKAGDERRLKGLIGRHSWGEDEEYYFCFYGEDGRVARFFSLKMENHIKAHINPKGAHFFELDCCH